MTHAREDPRTARLSCSVIAALILISAFAGAADAGLERTPRNRVLVVIANLKEAWGTEDLGNLREMRVFTRRLINKLPARPDVLLLQEVRHRSASRVASLLGEKTNDAYRVAVDPGRQPSRRISEIRVRYTETAILLNKDTMSKASQGAFIRSNYKARHRAPSTDVSIFRQALLLAKEDATGTTIAVASVHLLVQGRLKTLWLSERYRDRWAKQVADELRARYARSDITVIGGDFNQDLCKYDFSPDCSPRSDYYESLTNGPYDFIDAEREVDDAAHGIDLIFTSGTTFSGSADANYDPWMSPNDPKYYSDHRFRWAMVGS